MGCNYYLHKNICECCGRYDILHIGKSSGGWKFHFEGTEYAWEETQIKSYKDWKEEFEKGVIKDEYDNEISPEAFDKMVQGKQKCKEEMSDYDKKTMKYYLDEEGYVFYGREFS